MPVLGRARLDVCRVNAFRLGHFDVIVKMTVGGTLRHSTITKSSLVIRDVRGAAPNTASFDTGINPGWTPTRGQAVVIGLGSISNVVFGGQIETVAQTYEGILTNLVYRVTCTDYTRLLNRRKVWTTIDGVDAAQAVLDLLSTYTSGFSSDTTKIKGGLGTVSDLVFAGADVTDVLDAIAQQVGAIWFVDYTRRVHLEVVSTDVAPHPVTESGVHGARDATYVRQLRQARTRIYVMGASSRVSVPVSVGATILPVEDIARFVEGDTAVIGPDVITYTGTSAGTDDTAALVAGTPQALTAPSVALGRSASTVAVSSMTRSGSTVTVTTGAAHGFSTGLPVKIAGADQNDYNGTFAIATVPTTTTFTFAVAGSPTTPATGATITAQKVAGGGVIGIVSYKATAIVARASGSSTRNFETDAGTASGTATGATLSPPAAVTAAEAHSASTVAIDSITRSNGTATVTTSAAHGYAAGMQVLIAGAAETPYNGVFTIQTVGSTTTFTYRVSGAPATPATGTITAQSMTSGPLVGAYRYALAHKSARGETLRSAEVSVTATEVAAPGALTADFTTTASGNTVTASSLTRSSDVATFNTMAAHGLVPGMRVRVSGAAETAYNGIVTVATVVDGDSFTYAVSGAPSTPATGTILVHRMDVGVEPGARTYKAAYETASGGLTALGTASSTVTITPVADAGTPTATASTTTDGGLPPGTYLYGATFVTAEGETFLLGGDSEAVSAVTAPGTATLAETTGGNLTLLTTYNYKIAYYTAGGEVLSASAAQISLTGSNNAVSLSSIPTSADGRVVGRKIYRSTGVTNIYQLVATIGDNTATTHTDLIADANLTTLAPTSDTTGGQIALSSIPTSTDSRVIARNLWRTRAGGIEFYLLGTLNNNTDTFFTDTLPDASLGAGAPSRNSTGGQIGLSSIPVSSDARVRRRRLYRTKAGGTEYFLLRTIDDNTTTALTDNIPDTSLTDSAPAEAQDAGAAIKLTGLEVSSDPRVTGRAIYRTVAGGTEFRYVASIDNVVTTFTDTTPDAQLGATSPPTNTFGGDAVIVSSIPLGPAGTVARKIYRTEAGGSVYKYAGTIGDALTTTYTDFKADADLGDPAPAASQLGPVAGDTTLRVSDLSKFNANGGWAIVSGQPIRYTARSAASGEGTITGIPASGVGAILVDIATDEAVVNSGYLTGVSGLDTAVEAGTAIRLRVMRENTAAQTALATLEGGDGIHEHTIDAGDLATVAECEHAGDRELDDFDAGEDSFTYVTRDPNLGSNRTLTINIGAPLSISESMTIQDVSWTGFEEAYETVNGARIPIFPKATVTAGRTRLTLDDLLRMVQTVR
jgi:hypothetical protein